MYIDLSARTIHCARFPDHLVVGVWSKAGARQDWTDLGLVQPLSRLSPGFEEASEQRGRSPMRLYQVRSAGSFMIKTLVRVRAGPSPAIRYFGIRTSPTHVQILGPVNRMGRFTNSSTPEERAEAVRPIFAGRVWLHMTLDRLSYADLPFVIEAPPRRARASRPVREQAERPTAWDRLGEDF